MASREIFWNVGLGEIVYLLGFVVVAIVAYSLYRRLRLWRLGSADERVTSLSSRIRTFVGSVADGLWHRRIVRDRYVALMHVLIFGGFGLLLMGPLLDFISEHFIHFMVSPPILSCSYYK